MLGGAPSGHKEREDADLPRVQRLGGGDGAAQALLLVVARLVDRRLAHRAADRRDAKAALAQQRGGLRQLRRVQVEHVLAPGAAQLQVVDALGGQQVELLGQVGGDLVAKGAEGEFWLCHVRSYENKEQRTENKGAGTKNQEPGALWANQEPRTDDYQ